MTVALTLPYRMQIRLGSGVAVDDRTAVSFRSEGMSVEVSGRIERIPLAEGATAWLAGDVDGIRSRSGEWQSPLDSRNFGIDPRNPAASCARMEGRFVLLVTGPGDRCWIGTDSQGRADVYVSRDGRTIATDLSLIPSPSSGGYDQGAWAHTLLAYGYRAPKRHTPYTAVRRLGVGESAEIVNGAMTLSQRPFTPGRTATLETRSLNEYADRLLSAVQLRGSHHGNVVYLSSGWDSTGILACLVHLFGHRKVRAVIGRMKYANRSGIINQFEIDRAHAIADYYKIPLETVEFDYTKQGPACLEAVGALFRENNIASITGINHYLLAQHVANTTGGDETVFAGEISDGAHNLGFSQFVSVFHPVQAFREYADKMAGYLFGPTFLEQLHAGTHTTDAVYEIMRGRAGVANLDAPEASRVARTKQLLASLFCRGSRFPLSSLSNVQLLTQAGAANYSATIESEYLGEAAEHATGETLYSWYLQLYNSFHWQGSTVATLALTGDTLGLRTALPFWDSRLQESLASMPEEAGRGLDLHPTKYPLKWTLEHRLDYPFHLQVGPHSYLYDVDPSFSHSAELLYGSSFGAIFRDSLRRFPHRDVLDPALFDIQYLDGVVTRFVEGTEVRGAELTDLMALALTASIGWY